MVVPSTANIPPPKPKQQETPDYRLDIPDLEYDSDWKYAVKRMPDPKCKKTGCYGRGFIGYHGVTKQPTPCECVGYWELLHEPKGGGSLDGPPEDNNAKT